MPFGIVGRTGPGMRQVVGFADRSPGRGTFGGAFGARYCNQWGFYGVRVRQCLNRRSCGLGWCVHAVGRGIAVSDGGQRSPTGRGFLGVLFRNVGIFYAVAEMVV